MTYGLLRKKKDYCDSEAEFVYEEFMMWDNAMSM